MAKGPYGPSMLIPHSNILRIGCIQRPKHWKWKDGLYRIVGAKWRSWFGTGWSETLDSVTAMFNSRWRSWLIATLSPLFSRVSNKNRRKASAYICLTVVLPFCSWNPSLSTAKSTDSVEAITRDTSNRVLVVWSSCVWKIYTWSQSGGPTSWTSRYQGYCRLTQEDNGSGPLAMVYWAQRGRDTQDIQRGPDGFQHWPVFLVTWRRG